jgi:oxygen-independent coproporphyrinogen-3 oxidase
MEQVMLGVRRREGLPLSRLGGDRRQAAAQLATYGLVEHEGIAQGRVVLTQRGRLLADVVVRELLG